MRTVRELTWSFSLSALFRLIGRGHNPRRPVPPKLQAGINKVI